VAQAEQPLATLIAVEGPGLATAFLGRMLADLGAQVHKFKVASDGESAAGAPDAAYRSVFGIGKNAVDETTIAGLLERADVLIVDGTDGLGRGQDIERLRQRYPGLIAVVLTPFGRSGPLARRPSSDLINLAMSGYLFLTGAPDGRPIKPTAFQVGARHACGHALVGILIALRQRRLTGRGSTVDVAIRDAALWMVANTYQQWELLGVNPARRGSTYSVGDMTRTMPLLFGCKDGYVVWMPLAGRRATATIRLVAWMAEQNAAPPWLRDIDWAAFELRSQQDVARFIEPFTAFFRSKTRADLLSASLDLDLMLAPVNSTADLLDDPQLEARQVWRTVAIDGWRVRLPRAPIRIEGLEWSPRS
jgi:crotonobetainyl-CoA:carnitine CoA-transferase CaiB-like acyl-CoA transferase